MQKQGYILVFFLVGFLGLLLKAAQIQVLDDTYKAKANRTTLIKKTLYPSRGTLYDRNHKLLVLNNPIYNVNATYNKVSKNIDTTKFCSLLEIDRSTFAERLNKKWRDPRYSKSVPFTFYSNANPKAIGSFMEHLHEFEGFETTIRNTRSYPHSNAAHTLGFMGEATKSDIANSEFSLGDYLGKTGLEKYYDSTLRGSKGQQYVLKDVVGRESSSYQNGSLDVNPVAGNDLITTLDIELQAYVEEIMVGKRGSVVAIEPATGEILTMVSSPNYDPNVLNFNSERGDVYTNLSQDSINKPLLNRSITTKYPPGSIFKPILSLIAMQEGVWSPYKSVNCPGYYQYRTFKYGCHPHVSPLSMKSALQHSCNSYFFQMLRDVVEKEGWSNPEVGLTILNEHLYDFGLGVKTGIDIPGESRGFVPTPKYYNDLYNDKYSTWKSTYIMSIGIGQGELELTTLQIANLATILANRGYYIQPHLVKQVVSPQGEIKNEQHEKRSVRIDAEHFEPVIDGMRQTVQYGTGQSAAVTGVTVCGKTGTAQNPQGKDHSVFFAFAPKDDPQIAVAVFIENGGFGATIAAPMTGLVIEKYLKGEISPYKKNTENRMKAINIIQ